MSRYRGRGRHRWLKVLLALILAGAISFAALLGSVLWGSRDQIRGAPQTMIILGCQVRQDGPSVLLQDRLDTALDYLEGHQDLTVVVSGGQWSNEPTTEARAMADYLMEHGVAEANILLEDASHNTFENIANSVRLLEEEGVDLSAGVLIVSNGFHLTRARMLWDRVTGQPDALSTLAAPSSHLPSRLQMYIREPLALVKSFFLDR